MMFMNTFEIDAVVRRYSTDPVLGPAARTLRNLRDAADQNSDGWAYWPKPCRAAAKLQEILYNAHLDDFRPVVGFGKATAEDVRKALRPVKAFRTRSGIDFEIEAV